MGKQTKDQVQKDQGIEVVSFTKYKPLIGHVNVIRVYKNTQAGKQKQRIVSIDDNNVQHIGKSFSGQTCKAVKYVVGAKDPITGKIEYIETTHPLIIQVRKSDQKPKFEINQPTYDVEHKKRLVQQFGTNKSKRKMNQMMNNIIQ